MSTTITRPRAENRCVNLVGTGDSLSKIPVPVLILKADASPERRKAHEEAADGLISAARQLIGK